MLVFKVLVLLLLSLIGFIFEIKNIIYYINNSNFVLLAINVIAFGCLGYVLMFFGKRIDNELMEKSKNFDFLIPIIYLSMGMSFLCQFLQRLFLIGLR